MLLSPKALRAFTDRTFDSFEWLKGVPRDRLLQELSRFRVPPAFKSDPWLHQLVCVFICACQPRFLVLLDMGLGKTKIGCDVITHKKRERKLNRRVLVTVPRTANLDSWSEDIPRHSDLEPHTISAQEIAEKRYQLLHPKGDVTLIDYHGLSLALTQKTQVREGRKRAKVNRLLPDPELVSRMQALYGTIWIDEVHKLRNSGSLWYQLMLPICDGADHVYGASGTLFGRDPMEAWAQFRLADRGETFGQTPSLFAGTFFRTKPDPWKGVKLEYIVGKTRLLNKMLAHRSIRYDEDEVQDLPPLVNHRVLFDMQGEQEELYLQAVEGVINGDDLKAPWYRMRCLTSGYLHWKDDHGEHMIKLAQNPKLEACLRIIADGGDSKIVISYEYTRTGQLISDRLKAEKIDHEWYYGGTKDKSASRRRFLSDPECRVFLMQSEVGGTGTDGLQRVARYLIAFESPTNPRERRQLEKRIHRPGSSRRCFVYDLVARRSVDSRILKRLEEGRDLYEELLGTKNKSLLARRD